MELKSWEKREGERYHCSNLRSIQHPQQNRCVGLLGNPRNVTENKKVQIRQRRVTNKEVEMIHAIIQEIIASTKKRKKKCL